MWRVYKEAGRPWPVLSDDDVLDYMVMEAVALKVQSENRQAEEEAAKQEEIREWKKKQKKQLLELT